MSEGDVMNVQSRFSFPSESLPPGFRFPDVYLEVLYSPELPELTPWWFLAENERLALFWQRVLREQYPTRSLIPFAKWDPSDDLACFDGMDVSGDPKVLLIHAYTTPGWEHRGTLPSFGAWMAKAVMDARKFEAGEV